MHNAFPIYNIINVYHTSTTIRSERKAKISLNLTLNQFCMESKTFTKILHIISRDAHLITIKGKVIPIHAIKAHSEHGDRVPPTLNLGTTWRYLSFTPWLLRPEQPMKRRLCRTYSHCHHLEYEKNLLPMPILEPWNIQPIAWSLHQIHHHGCHLMHCIHPNVKHTHSYLSNTIQKLPVVQHHQGPRWRQATGRAGPSRWTLHYQCYMLFSPLY